MFKKQKEALDAREKKLALAGAELELERKALESKQRAAEEECEAMRKKAHQDAESLTTRQKSLGELHSKNLENAMKGMIDQFGLSVAQAQRNQSALLAEEKERHAARINSSETELQGKWQDFRGADEKLRQAQEEAARSQSEAESAIRSCGEEREQLKQEHSQRREELNAEYEQKAAQNQEHINLLESKLSELKNQLERDYAERKQILEDDYKTLKEFQNEQREADREELQKSYEGRIEELQKQNVHLGEVMRDLQKKIDFYQEIKDRFNGDPNDFMEEFEKLSETNSRLEERKNKLVSELGRYQQHGTPEEFAAEQERYREFNEEQLDLHKRLDAAERKGAEYDSIKEHLALECDNGKTLKENLENKNKELAEYKADNEELKNRLNEKSLSAEEREKAISSFDPGKKWQIDSDDDEQEESNE